MHEFRPALKFLHEAGITDFGFELGSWYGFCGVPMETGIASFHDLLSFASGDTEARARWRILMPRLDVDLDVHVRVRPDGSALETDAVVTARRDSLLGDLAIHAKFATAGQPVGVDGQELTRPRKYIYLRRPRATFTVQGKSLVYESGAEAAGMSLLPYACRVSAGEARFHTRLLAEGGQGQRLVLTTRGALSNIELGPCPAALGPWLYRVERRAPRFFPNTQLCSAIRLATGQSVRLRQTVAAG